MASMEHHLRDIESIHKDFKRIEKSGKVVARKQKERVEDMRERLNEKLQSAKEKYQAARVEAREKTSHLLDKDKKREELIREVKDAFQEEVNQKKEISLLKKRDQQENYERGKNFQYLYKKKLVERLLEKKERGDRVKQ